MRDVNPTHSTYMVYENYKKSKESKLLDRHARWKKQADAVGLSAEGRKRLSWIIHAEVHNNISKTCRYYGIGESTFYKWKKRFKPSNLKSLENKSKAPHKRRGRKKVCLLDERVIKLRKKYMYYGKMKLQVIYKREYGEDITSWYIQRVIEEKDLYPPRRKKKGSTKRKKQYNKPKKRITELKNNPQSYGALLHTDTVEIRLQGVKRYVLTCIDSYSRFGFAYAYKNHTSVSAKDFIMKLYDFFGENIKYIHTDNGSEFHKHFDTAVTKLNLTHYWSRVRKSTDNAKDERFNRTFRDECLSQGAFHKDLNKFNKNILNWNIEYLTIRPHQSLNYLTPFQFINLHSESSTMWSSSTHP